LVSLKNKIILITGASSGIGAACAEQFAAQGAKLILIARRQERLTELTERLKPYQIPVLVQTLDVTSQEAVQQFIANLPSEWQAIDALINNAGLAAGLDKLYQADITDWEAMINTNVKGLLYVSRYVVPGMVARNAGHIINIGSIAGHQNYAGGSVYCGTKAAVNSITQCLKLDLTGTAVRVTTIDPGMVETEFSQVRFKGDNQRAEQVYKGMIPLTANDIADAIVYCATRPAHVNILEMILLPTAQSAATVVHRENA
jgi:serine 3-dehydrogenase